MLHAWKTETYWNETKPMCVWVCVCAFTLSVCRNVYLMISTFQSVSLNMCVCVCVFMWMLRLGFSKFFFSFYFFYFFFLVSGNWKCSSKFKCCLVEDKHGLQSGSQFRRKTKVKASVTFLKHFFGLKKRQHQK